MIPKIWLLEGTRKKNKVEKLIRNVGVNVSRNRLFLGTFTPLYFYRHSPLFLPLLPFLWLYLFSSLSVLYFRRILRCPTCLQSGFRVSFQPLSFCSFRLSLLNKIRSNNFWKSGTGKWPVTVIRSMERSPTFMSLTPTESYEENWKDSVSSGGRSTHVVVDLIFDVKGRTERRRH